MGRGFSETAGVSAFQNVSTHSADSGSPHDNTLYAGSNFRVQDALDVRATSVLAFQNVSTHSTNSQAAPQTAPQIAPLTPVVQRAVDWLRQNPDAAALSVRKAAQRSGLSETSIHKARKHLGL